MAIELPDGKTARNLQEQVKFLSEKLKDLYAAVSEIGIKVLIVEELPEEGEPMTIYFVPSEDASQENIYNEYMWIEDEWELIGSTAIDLSGYAELSGNNDFTGTNTFKSLSTVSPDGTQNAHFEVADNGNIDLKHNTDNLMSFTSTNYVVYNHLRPRRETYNLGDPDYRWQDLFLCGAIKNSDKINFRPNSVSYDLFSVSSSEVLTWVGIRPAANGSLNLGTATSKWQNLYLSGRVDFGNDAYIVKDQYDRITLNVSDNAKIVVDAGQTYVNNNLLPLTATRDLGSNDYKWRDLYLSRNLTDGTNSIAVANIANKNNFVSLTQAQYDALGTKDPDTFYFIQE